MDALSQHVWYEFTFEQLLFELAKPHIWRSRQRASPATTANLNPRLFCPYGFDTTPSVPQALPVRLSLTRLQHSIELVEASFAINTSVNASINFSPFQLLFSYVPRIPLQKHCQCQQYNLKERMIDATT